MLQGLIPVNMNVGHGERDPGHGIPYLDVVVEGTSQGPWAVFI